MVRLNFYSNSCWQTDRLTRVTDVRFMRRLDMD